MALESICILGLRGFAEQAKIEFAVPDGTPGSGLTVITGPNNAGKSTALEALQAFAGHGAPSFHNEKRNSSVDAVYLKCRMHGAVHDVTSVKKGSAQSNRTNQEPLDIFSVPSRRYFDPYFTGSGYTRQAYISNAGLPNNRSGQNPHFVQRLFNAEKAPSEFNKMLHRVLGYTPDWSIDESAQGRSYLKFSDNTKSHSSEGIGEGLISLFCIVDALYDSDQFHVITIDEPELSLHPSLQKNLLKEFLEYSRSRQIVLCTHSPYFVSLAALKAGGKLHLVRNEDTGSKVHSLSIESINFMASVGLSDQNNPHIFGINACELFFMDDKLVLAEGQEDVVLYPRVLDQLDIEFRANFFGWGVGGADKMDRFCKLLNELGFKKVFGLLDGDKEQYISHLQATYPNYKFSAIPADDIRTKGERILSAKTGLLDENFTIREEYKQDTEKLFSDVSDYFS